MADVAQRLEALKALLDADIAHYCDHLKSSTQEQYGRLSRMAVDAFCTVLERDCNRLQGCLVIEGYRMCGGTNEAMIVQAARATEMLQAYRIMIENAHTSRDAGTHRAIEAALLGNHAAQTILANLDAAPELRTNVLSITNRSLGVAVHGLQVARLRGWSQSTYMVLNPLHVGMVLAGADCHATDAITEYAHALGAVLQEDIVGDRIIHAKIAQAAVMGQKPHWNKAGQSFLENLPGLLADNPGT